MAKQNIFKRFFSDTVFRNRFTLTFSFVWGLLLTLYYGAIGAYLSTAQDPWIWSWFNSLAIWYLVIVVFKCLLMINAFRIKNDKWIDFKLMTIVYLFINLFEVLIITVSPSFFTRTFSSKINGGITISSLVVSTVNVVMFILNCISVNREKFRRNEADFLQTKKYIGRTEGLFNILLVIINILILCEVSVNIIKYVYMGVGIFFALTSLIIAIKLIKQRKWDKAHKK